MVENIHYNDDMFHAALVSIGAMGVIYAVILDVVPQYSLLAWNKRSTWERLKIETGPNLSGLFDGSWSGLAEFMLNHPERFGGEMPRFAQVVVNPIKDDDGNHSCYVSNRIQLPLQRPEGDKPAGMNFSEVKAAVISEIIHGLAHRLDIGAALDGLVRNFLQGQFDQCAITDSEQNLINFCKDNELSWVIRYAIDAVMQLAYPTTKDNPQIDVGYKVMAPGGTNRGYPTLFGTAIEPAFQFEDAINFVDAALSEFDRGVDYDGVYPAGWLSLRVTGKTDALLGMQQYHRTGTVEVVLIALPDGNGVVQRLEDMALGLGGILHWGLSIGHLNYDFLHRGYNGNIETWKVAQHKLGGTTFTNYLMQRCGLV